MWKEELVILEGKGLELHDGSFIKFEDIAREDENGDIIYPPVNSKGMGIPYVRKKWLEIKGEVKYASMDMVIPQDCGVRYKHWGSKPFALSLSDILKMLCAWDVPSMKNKHVNDPDNCLTCRDCIQYEPHNGHVSTAVCKKGLKSGKFRAGSSVCFRFQKEWTK